MPYVDKIPDREFLNPHIDKIVHFIEQNLEKSTNTFSDYAEYIKFIWAELAYLLYKKYIGIAVGHPFGIRNSIARELRSMIYGLYSAIIQLDERHNYKGAFAGDLNYSCTEIALRTWPTKHYWAISLLGGITQRVGHELLKIFYPNDAIGDQIIGVFMNDIPAEFYRRIVAEYEDAKIREFGDVSGYLKWLPTEKKEEEMTDFDRGSVPMICDKEGCDYKLHHYHCKICTAQVNSDDLARDYHPCCSENCIKIYNKQTK